MPILFAIIFTSSFSFAQSVSLKDQDLNQEGTTTIEIKKTKSTTNSHLNRPDIIWEMADGTADIQGEAAAIKTEAEKTWKKACDVWKKEFREDNKDNKIISLNCGLPSCGGSAGSLTCTSKSTYKIKTRLN